MDGVYVMSAELDSRCLTVHAVVANCCTVVPLVQIMDSLVELFLIYFLVIIVKNMPNIKYKFLFLILICVNSELF